MKILSLASDGFPDSRAALPTATRGRDRAATTVSPPAAT
jgi:hypothetical protein